MTLFLGCAGKLRTDPVPISALDANYPTVEVVVAGTRVNGLGILSVEPGTPLSDLDIYLQGYHKGTFTVDSANCGVHEKFRYDGFVLHKIPMRGTFNQSCFLDIVASHEWPEEDASGIVIPPVKGRIWLINTNKKHIKRTSKAKDIIGDTIKIPSNEEEVRVVFRGCGADFDEKLPTQGGATRVSLEDVIDTIEHPRCSLVGAAIDSTQRSAVYWMAWTYSIEFTPLSIPSLSLKDDGVGVEADPGVSIISLDNKFEIANEASFDIDWSKAHVLRLITVKGRLIIGEWDPIKKEWSWKA